MSTLSAKKLRKAFGKTLALSSVSLEMKAGECLHLTGPNGAGKSTLLLLLAGLIEADAGELLYGNQTFFPAKHTMERARLLRQIGYLGRSSFCYPELSVQENLELVAELSSKPLSALELEELMAFVGLRLLGKTLAAELSAGFQRRLALARLMLLEPRYVFLDEPLTHLDQKGQAILCQALSFWKEKKVTLIVVSHEKRILAGVIDRTLKLERGRIAGGEF